MESSISINRLFPGEKLKKDDPRWGKFNGAFENETQLNRLERVQRSRGSSAVLGSVCKGCYILSAAKGCRIT